MLCRGFDPFSHGGKAERFSEGDHAVDDGQRSPTLLDVPNELAGNLEVVHGQVLQVRQGGVPGAKIIDVDFDASSAKGFEDVPYSRVGR